MEIARLQYISQETPTASHLDAIRTACEAGCRWIQLRIKNCSEDHYLQQAEKAKNLCEQYNALLIINDSVTVAQAVQAAGVHLGKTDMPPKEARKILGEKALIGGTANTFEDILSLTAQGVDYIGLGPFRHTTTKQNLSPILGLKGYASLLEKCSDHHIDIPIIAIGGIKMKDVIPLFSTGIYGIAVSGMLTHNKYKKETVTTFHRIVEQLVLKENIDL